MTFIHLEQGRSRTFLQLIRVFSCSDPTRRKRKAATAFWGEFTSGAGYAVQLLLTWPRRRLRDWLVTRTLERVDVTGMPVMIDSDDAENRERICAVLRDALARLTAWAPRRRHRLDRTVRRILIQPGTTAAYFHPSTIVIPIHAFDQPDHDAIASYIVHEGVHAQIEARGIRYWPHLRARIERCCLREQIRFLASRGRTDLVEYCEEHLRQRYSGD